MNTISTATTDQTTTRKTLARISMIAIIAYQALLIALIFIRPDLDPSWHTISEWAIGQHGWIMTTAFLISAVSYTALFTLLTSQVRGVVGYAGLIILGICALGTFGVGIFTTDPMTTRPEDLSATGIAHMATGGSALMFLPFAALLINISLATKNENWKASKRALWLTAFVPLIGLIAFMTYHAIYVAPLGPYAYGPGVHIGWPPRVALFSYMIWVVVVTKQYLRLLP